MESVIIPQKSRKILPQVFKPSRRVMLEISLTRGGLRLYRSDRTGHRHKTVVKGVQINDSIVHNKLWDWRLR